LIEGSLVTQPERDGIILYRRSGSTEAAETSLLSFRSADIAWPRHPNPASYFEAESGVILELKVSRLSFHLMDGK